MTGDLLDELKRSLSAYGQEHLVRWWHELAEPDRRSLYVQIRQLDLEQIASLVRSRSGRHAPDADSESRRAIVLSSIVRLPRSADDRDRWERARRRGEELLKAGKVGAILVAGGQGTRLGFDKPKGMLSIGPVSRATLFQILAEQVLARSRRAGRPIPYFIMTSDATHADTASFFEEHEYFGLPPGDVYFFSQANMPAVDAASGRILLADKKTLCLSPDGHGGILGALARAGLLEEMKRRGVELLYYHQVDNPTAIVCDPVALGFHAEEGAQMSTKVVAKRSAEERMGVVVQIDGRTRIIEYSDLPLELAQSRDAGGGLSLWAGNTAIHIFNRSFLEQIAQSAAGLPFHVAHKKVAYCDDGGRVVSPQTENALKFEKFIFDALPLADRTLTLEADRKREFNPVKNAAGDDSPATAQNALVRLHRSWLEEAGAQLDPASPVEISPLFALDAEDVRPRIKPGTRFDGPVYLDPTASCGQ